MLVPPVLDLPRHMMLRGIRRFKEFWKILRKNRDDKHLGGSSAQAASYELFPQRGGPFRRPKTDLFAHRERDRSCTAESSRKPDVGLGCRSPRKGPQSDRWSPNAKRTRRPQLFCSAAPAGPIKQIHSTAKINPSRNLFGGILRVFLEGWPHRFLRRPGPVSPAALRLRKICLSPGTMYGRRIVTFLGRSGANENVFPFSELRDSRR